MRGRLGAAKLATTGNKAALVERLLPAPSGPLKRDRARTAEADPEGGGGEIENSPPPRLTNIHSVHCRLHYIINLRMC